MLARGFLAVAAVVLLAGCFSELLPAPLATRLGFACAVLDPERAETAVVQSWVGDGVDLERGAAVSALLSELVAVSGRDPQHVNALEREGPSPPRGGWDEASLQAWARETPFLRGGVVALRVLWLATLGDGNLTGVVVAPATVAVSQAGVLAGAQGMGVEPAAVARAVLLHAAGHALGAVNQGIPVQDPDIQEREGPPTHDPDPTSVLFAGWDDARTMAWDANATYDRYPDALHRDWAAATQPGGACL